MISNEIYGVNSPYVDTSNILFDSSKKEMVQLYSAEEDADCHSSYFSKDDTYKLYVGMELKSFDVGNKRVFFGSPISKGQYNYLNYKLEIPNTKVYTYTCAEVGYRLNSEEATIVSYHGVFDKNKSIMDWITDTNICNTTPYQVVPEITVSVDLNSLTSDELFHVSWHFCSSCMYISKIWLSTENESDY